MQHWWRGGHLSLLIPNKMKTILILILCLVVQLTAHSSTWTIHGVRDNYLSLIWFTDYADMAWSALWDYQWDQDNCPDSGFWANPRAEISCDCVVAYGVVAYSDVLICDVPDGVPLQSLSMAEPAPYYNGWVDSQLLPEPGEYWIDWNQEQSIRISTTQPADFGKWAWDGSINPSWVEPLAAKKGHGKGHVK